jgi:hypothetical protein
MAVPDFQSLMLPVLMATANGDIPASDLRDRVATSLNLVSKTWANYCRADGRPLSLTALLGQMFSCNEQV